jgi:hypothetical protein
MTAESKKNISVPMPENKFVRMAGVWIAMYLARIFLTVAGVSNSKSIPFSSRAPTIGLTTVGTIFIVLWLLANSENWFKKTESETEKIAKRAWIFLIILLCIMAPFADFYFAT